MKNDLDRRKSSGWRAGFWPALMLGLSLAVIPAGPVAAQTPQTPAPRLLRQIRQQQRREEKQRQAAEKKNLAPVESAYRPAGHSLDGISQRGLITLFSREERELVIPGFGRAPALLVIYRQLDLTAEQRAGIKALRSRIGNRLIEARQKYARTEQQLEDSIYGENFDPKRVEEFSADAAAAQGEATKLQAEVESQFRQILTPDQFLVFRFLVGEMLLPQRRLPPGQLRPQPNQRRIPSPPGQLNPPDINELEPIG